MKNQALQTLVNFLLLPAGIIVSFYLTSFIVWIYKLKHPLPENSNFPDMAPAFIFMYAMGILSILVYILWTIRTILLIKKYPKNSVWIWINFVLILLVVSVPCFFYSFIL